MKVVENSPQNARNCTIFKKILVGGGGMPPNPPSKGSQLRGMYIQNPKKFYSCPPPLRNPAYAPEIPPPLQNTVYIIIPPMVQQYALCNAQYQSINNKCLYSHILVRHQ